MVYKNQNQSKILTFNESDNLESISFSPVSRLGGIVLSSISLVDFDKGSYTLSSSEIAAIGSSLNFTVSESNNVETPLFTRTFNSPAEPYEVSQNATFNADHILLSNQINEEWSNFWGLAEWADEPMPVTFTGMHRVEVDFYDYVGPDATFILYVSGPYSGVETEISTVSGTLVVDALLFESGEGAIYVQLKDQNSSIKISEIRIYEAQ
jgi:hypothetical protein